ncbi:MAG: type II toxin-antitoxin system RelB/DinJ family antitoxin [bacterium]
MSNKTKDMTQIQVRIDTKTKESAKKILNELGLDISTAVKTFLRQVIMVGGLPYELRDVNGYAKGDVKKIKESYEDAVKNGKRFNTTKDALDDLYV